MKKGRTVLITSGIAILVLVFMGILMPGTLERFTEQLQALISDYFGWYYLLLVTAFLLVCLYLLISPVGRVKLGKPDEKPEFSRISWLAMLFSAGMGIGLVFFGTAEPISHYAISSPTGETGTPQAVTNALQYTFFHWGLHGWAIYGILAMAIAYQTYRKDEPGLISSTLRPIFGNNIESGFGNIVDIIAVLATVIGVATTLGFGATQVNAGLQYLFGFPVNIWVQVLIVGVFTVLFLLSAWSGLNKGIKYLSNVNMILAGVLFFIMLAVGPTLYLLNLFTDTIGVYVQNLPRMSFRIAPFDENIRDWINQWTIFYWAWWIAWAPFVGIFIARVSRGRTIREFVFAVLLIPTLVCCLWFTVFGGSAINLESAGEALISNFEIELMLFEMFSHFGFGMLMSIAAIIVVSIFFVTSADSATIVLGTLSTNGSPTPANKIKMTWGLLLSATALVLLYTGGLQALQNTLIIAALPFSFVMLLMMAGLILALRKESKRLGPGRIRSKLMRRQND